jgi:hypothetical protein
MPLGSELWKELGMEDIVQDTMQEDRLILVVLELLLQSPNTATPNYTNIHKHEMLPIDAW